MGTIVVESADGLGRGEIDTQTGHAVIYDEEGEIVARLTPTPGRPLDIAAVHRLVQTTVDLGIHHRLHAQDLSEARARQKPN